MSDQAVLDAASYVLQKFEEPISTMKLQKLVFLSHAWHLAFTDEPLVSEAFEAWRYGPVSRSLYRQHRQEREVNAIDAGDPTRLSAKGKIIVDAVVKNYGALGGIDLSDLTHKAGSPWHTVRIRNNLSRDDSSRELIPDDLIKEYYKKELQL
ncbi:hypothetical protein Csp1_25680 [Corynebacterium provencense]|uniref:Antitoxin SocA-like Panacea domain-containing protein n=1 Tax=Corynebacterium provencense TaxID=1737425 RepID=A0A2Z3YR31_9CORY|nr:type II toxin-antitoxin system antitoxin SocA domain-containing protein [Corynebacterium provencense]AWT27316.1 hypothetical protein Csp1_25680 [Corynebacterium provencense]